MNYSINVARITEIHLSENETISTFHTLYQDEFQMDQRFKCINLNHKMIKMKEENMMYPFTLSGTWMLSRT